jgi:hypothetical protein
MHIIYSIYRHPTQYITTHLYILTAALNSITISYHYPLIDKKEILFKELKYVYKQRICDIIRYKQNEAEATK